ARSLPSFICSSTRSRVGGVRLPVIMLLLAVLCAPCVLAQKETPPEHWHRMYNEYISLLEGYRAFDQARVVALNNFWEAIDGQEGGTIDHLLNRLPVRFAPLSQMALTGLALAAFSRGDKYMANKHLQIAQRWIDLKLKLPGDEPLIERQRRF